MSVIIRLMLPLHMIYLWVPVVFVELERVCLERRLRDHRLLDRAALRAERHALARRRARIHVVEGVGRRRAVRRVTRLRVARRSAVGRVLEPRRAKDRVDVRRRRLVTRASTRAGLVRVVRLDLAAAHGRVVVQWRRVERRRTRVNLRSSDRWRGRHSAVVLERVGRGPSALAREHGHVLRQALVDRTLVRALEALVDPDRDRSPESTTDTDAHTDDDVALALVVLCLGVRSLVRLRLLVHVRRDRVRGVDLRSDLAGEAGLVVQRRRGRRDVRLERAELVLRNVAEPLGAELVRLARGLVDLEGDIPDVRDRYIKSLREQLGESDEDLRLRLRVAVNERPGERLQVEQDRDQRRSGRLRLLVTLGNNPRSNVGRDRRSLKSGRRRVGGAASLSRGRRRIRLDNEVGLGRRVGIDPA